MKRALKITALALVYLFLCGKSCQDDQEITLRQEEEVAAIKDSLRSEFETEYLSEESRFALEASAIQKIKDLADYLTIFLDPAMDSLFRQQAAGMITGMFHSMDAELSIGFPPTDNETSGKVRDIFGEMGWHGWQSIAIEFDSLTVPDHLQRSGTGSYHGKIRGHQKLTFKPVFDSVSSFHDPVTIHISASQEEKIFGPDTLRVWSIFLGDMVKDQ